MFKYLYWVDLYRGPDDVILKFKDTHFDTPGAFDHPGHIANVLSHNGVKRYLNDVFGYKKSMGDPVYTESNYEKFLEQLERVGKAKYTQKSQFGTMEVIFVNTHILPNQGDDRPTI